MTHRTMHAPHTPTSAPLERAAACPNCRAPLHGRYCAACGQDQRADRKVGVLLRGALEDAFDVDSRLWRSLRLLISRPGFLSAEHVAGRRARYLPPTRLYLLSSLLVFTAAAFSPLQFVHLGAAAERQAAVAAEPADAERSLAQTLDRRITLAADEPERVNEVFVGGLPWVMFVLIPVFALLLHVLHVGSGLLYVHHLVFALHFHAFGFLSLAAALAATIPAATSEIADVALVLAANAVNAVYLYVAARRFYGQGRGMTFLKLAALAFWYLLALALGMFATFIAVVLLFWSG